MVRERHPRRVRLAVGGLAALTLVPSSPTADAQVPVRFDAVIEPFEVETEEVTFPTFDAKGRRLPPTSFRVISGTGNDRENYLASTRTGMLLDFGGEWLRFSTDEGLTWSEVLPPDEFREWWSYEGAVAVAPGGDVVAAGQDALASGIFRAMTFKYEAAADKWYYSFAESNSPFLDRPAIGVLPGPFQIGGVTVPYVSVLRGGLLLTKSYWTYSLDGLNYSLPNTRLADTATGLPHTGPLDVEEWSELDWIQSHELIGVAPYGRAKALAERPSIGTFDSESHAPRSILDPKTLRWTAHEFPAEGPPQTSPRNCVDETNWPPCLSSEGRTLADSRGNLHHISLTSDSIVYRFSSDGGATWSTSTTKLLEGHRFVVNQEMYKSFKVSGAHSTSVVAVHTVVSKDPPLTQDLVYGFSFKNGPPRVQRIYALGNGGYSCLAGATIEGTPTEGSCDFPSITMIPGGRFAASFTDAQHKEPAIALELGR